MRYKITLSIFGDFDVSLLTKLVEIEPTKVCIKGEKGEYTIYKETSWNYTVNSNELDFSEPFQKIILKFQNHKDLLNSFVKKNDLTVKIFVAYYIYDSIIPSLYLNHNFLEFLTNINSEIDFDGYNFNKSII